MRGSDTEAWQTRTFPESVVQQPIQGMIRWVEARQRGVSRARQDVSASKAKVFHALEVNKVYDAFNGITTL